MKEVKEDPEMHVIIMRGLPGSGKSTAALCIARAPQNLGRTAIVSTDQWFTDRYGRYWFDPRYLAYYHDKCFEEFVRLCCAGVPVVILDNCNVQKRDYQRFVCAALILGYDVSVAQMVPHAPPEVLAERNCHGVPYDRILGMLLRWEDDDESCLSTAYPFAS